MNLFSRRRLLVLMVVLVMAASAIPALHYYHYYETHVSTDDAYVDGTVVNVAPRVASTVTTVYVSENFIVKPADLLVTLDPRDFEVRVEQARAQLARSRETVDQLFAQVAAAEAAEKLAASQLKQAELDFTRAAALRKAGVESQDAYDRAETALKMAKASVNLSQREVERARAALGGDTEDHARYSRSIVEQAEAGLKAAELELSYTQINAPVGGVVTRKSVHKGNRVAVGQPLLSIVPIESLYITANFKETQLTDVRVGQRADLTADVYPGYTYKAHVDSISFGTGSAFALLPPENATGNWVKVVQRVPIKIVFDQQQPPDKQLRLGLSVEVSIDISDTHGPLLSSTLQKHELDGAPGASPTPVTP
jgi:membrane fusion protein (multidrug efflux system)